VQLGELVAGYAAAVASTVQKKNPLVLLGVSSDGVQDLANTDQGVSSKTEIEKAEGHVQQLIRSPLKFHLCLFSSLTPEISSAF
jgi:hypothetical protein